MCRLTAYLGPDILLEDILVKPSNSLLKQSIHAKETKTPANGDGFGVGWYTPSISTDPALFVSVFPAWNDTNLLHITSKIKSCCFFGHVRAATIGGINTYNCHPFVYGKWMFMHNGDVYDFINIKRHLRHLLDDDIYNWIRGETDSEHIFALFLQLSKGKDLSHLSVVEAVLKETFRTLDHLIKMYSESGTSDKEKVSYYNICLTDGHRMIASRYTTNPNFPTESMYYFKEEKPGNTPEVMITSEKLYRGKTGWHEIPPSHFLLVDSDYSIQLKAIGL